MLPNLTAEAAARAEERLREQTVVWLTTVTPDGRPQTSPVGYLWDGATFLILSRPGAPKVRNVRGNPKVALHLDLDGDVDSFSVLTIEGLATLESASADRRAPLTGSESAAYVDRYRESMEWAGTTPEETFADYSTVIRVVPARARLY
jgi:PPOX class probable F420-dependent enzyme